MLNKNHRHGDKILTHCEVTTIAAFIEKLRVDAVRLRFEETDESIDEISKNCGFHSADSMRRSFHRVVKVAPSDYR